MFNERERVMVQMSTVLASDFFDIIQRMYKCKEMFDKEFATAQSNDLSLAEHVSDFEELGLAYKKLNTFYAQVGQELLDFRDGIAVGKRNRNKDIVEVMS